MPELIAIDPDLRKSGFFVRSNRMFFSKNLILENKIFTKPFNINNLHNHKAKGYQEMLKAVN